jgi:putative resolvase
MKANKVLKLLRISRPTLCFYVKNGKLKVTKLSNGYYDYDDESVYSILNKNNPRKIAIYCRVSSKNKMDELSKQKEFLKSHIPSNHQQIEIYSDISSGLNFNRKDFFRLISDVADHKISKVCIVDKSILANISFDFFQNLFEKFDCKIEIVGGKYDGEINSDIIGDISSMLWKISREGISLDKKKKIDFANDLLKIG